MTTKTADTYVEIGIPVNPFPGLRPFEFDESHLFFGREGQSESLIEKLSRTHFLAVVGTSGSGKSSLVRAGMLPTLLGGFMTSAGSNWRIAIMRPGNDPIGNLTKALNGPDVFGSEIEENAALQTALAEATLRRGSRGLVDAVRQAMMSGDENLLVVVDQFEEIFRFARVAEGEQYQNEAAAFVKLLLEASRERETPIYVVLTMRSDYLGDCSQFWELPEAINESQYLIPRLTRDQLRQAINGPVAVGGGSITPRLVNRLLNDVGDNQDQLPVLQHLLMRVWDESKEKLLEVEVKEGDATVRKPHKALHQGEALDLCCYEAVGGMAEALSRHADEAFNDLPDERSREVAEKLFKGLTEKGTDNREIRRPVTLGEICAMTGASAAEVVTVIEKFRQPGRSFLMPPADVALNAESLIDISHESLIRGWTKLKNWVEDEAKSARVYRRLADSAVLRKESRASLYSGLDLEIALTWRNDSKPNEVWARRYHPEFGLAMSFLEESVAARDMEFNEKETQRRKAIKRTRLTAIVFASLFLLSLVALFLANQQRVRANQQTVRVNGLLEELRLTSDTAKNNAVREARERFAREEAEKQGTVSRDQALEAKKLQAEADDQRKEALKQKGLAELQTAKVARLEKQARQEASEANAINSLARGINDELASKNVDGVVAKATQQLQYYEKRADPRGVFESLTILGPAYLEKGSPSDARQSASRALVMMKNDPALGNSNSRHENYTVLSHAYMKEAYTKEKNEGESDLRAGLEAAQQALRVQEDSFGPRSPEVIPDLNNLIAATDRLNESSEDFRVRIVNIQEKVLQEDSQQLVSHLNNLAAFYIGRRSYDRAETRLKEIIAIQEDTNDPHLVATLNSLVGVLRYEKKDSEADELVQRIQGLQGVSALLQLGTSGDAVRQLQLQLQKLGFDPGMADGKFGKKTERAVIEFQESRGLVADGIARPQTLSLLEQPPTAQIGALEIQTELKKLGFYSGGLDGSFGIRTKAALMAFQRSKGLVEDGTGNPQTLEALGLKTPALAPSITGKVTVEIVAKMFPGTPIDNIKANLPVILRALEDAGLSDKEMVLVALANMRADGSDFTPSSESKSRFNTSPEGHPFDLYDSRGGNQGPPDGERFRGRGFLQLFGRASYRNFGAAIGLGNQLVEYPELANQPDISAKLFASYVKENERRLRAALLAGDLKMARKIFNGGSPGLDNFINAFQTGASLLQ